MADMLDPVEFLQLQALNQYTYRTSISRAQTKLVLPERVSHLLALTNQRFKDLQDYMI